MYVEAGACGLHGIHVQPTSNEQTVLADNLASCTQSFTHHHSHQTGLLSFIKASFAGQYPEMHLYVPFIQIMFFFSSNLPCWSNCSKGSPAVCHCSAEIRVYPCQALIWWVTALVWCLRILCRARASTNTHHGWICTRLALYFRGWCESASCTHDPNPRRGLNCRRGDMMCLSGLSESPRSRESGPFLCGETFRPGKKEAHHEQRMHACTHVCTKHDLRVLTWRKHAVYVRLTQPRPTRKTTDSLLRRPRRTKNHCDQGVHRR